MTDFAIKHPKTSHESIHSLTSQASTILSDQHPDIDLPIQFKIYCDKNRWSTSIWYLGTQKGNQQKIISCHQGWRSKLSFHDGIKQTDPILASTVIRNSSIEVSSPIGEFVVESNSRLKAMRTDIDFTFTFPLKSGSETFTWQRSKGAEVKSLGGRGGGYVLVRAVTNEPVAVYSADYGHIKLSGRFKFMGSGVTGGLGREWAVVVIITALSVGQRKRDLINASAVAGASA